MPAAQKPLVFVQEEESGTLQLESDAGESNIAVKYARYFSVA
jgi:hypothetical protein